MNDKLSKQPLYKWPSKPFWLLVTPLLVLSWGGFFLLNYHPLDQMTPSERGIALIILGVVFAIVASARFVMRKRAGL
jgi:hypothetical protein